jgi:hypothetical protein
MSDKMTDENEHEFFKQQYEKVVSLEERLAYAEIARDNALAMRDEAQERLKDHRKNSGRVVSGLREVILYLAKHAPKETADTALNQMQAILDAGRKG